VTVHKTLLILVWVSVAAVAAGFFLPWAHLDLQEPHERLPSGVDRIAVTIRRSGQTISGSLPDLAEIPRQVSGVQIPQIANQQNTQLAVALMELFTQQRQHIGAKSYAVYLLPGVALLCGLLISLQGHRRAVAVGVALLCAAMAGAGFWKLLTTDTETLFVAITIGQGLWLSLWGYVGLAVAAAIHSLVNRWTPPQTPR